MTDTPTNETPKSLFDYTLEDAPSINAEISWDDDRLTHVLEHETEGRVGFFRNSWREYETGIWGEREKEEIRRMVKVFLRRFRSRNVKVTAGLISAIEMLLRDATFVSDRVLNELQREQKRYIPLRNGIYNLEDWKLEPHRKDLYFTYQLDFDYDEDADCPTFRKYLDTSLVTPDGAPDHKLKQFLQEAMAYCMTARTDLKASFWLLGKPDSGKSTFISFMRELMGHLHVSIDMEQMGKNQFMLSSLIGKRLATCTEAEAGTMIADGLYKALSGGGDAIWTDVKNKDGISFIPEVKLLWAMNNAPRTRDRSDAIFNRLKIIPFNRSVPKSERDPKLLEKLLAEKSGIFTQLMWEYRRLVRRGDFELPEQSQMSLEAYRLQNDTERNFLIDCTVPDTNGKIQANELYAAYRTWCTENGFRPKQRNEVSQDWERLKLTSRKSTGGHHFWYGATFKKSDIPF